MKRRMLLGLLATMAALIVARVTLWSGHGAVLRTVTLGIIPTSMLLDEASGRFYVADGTTPQLTILDAETGAPVSSSGPLAQSVNVPLAVHRSGHLFAADGHGTLLLLDLRTSAVIRTVSVPYSWATADEATARLYTVDGEATVLSAIDGRTGRVVGQAAACSAVAAPLLHGAGGHIFVPCSGGTVAVFDGRGGRRTGTIETGLGACECPLLPDTRTGRVFWPAGVGLAVLDARKAALVGTVPVQVWTGGAFKLDSHPADVDPRTGDLLVAPSAAGTGPAAETVLALDGRSGAIVHRWPVAANPTSILVNPLTGHVLVASAGPIDALGQPLGVGTLSVLDPASGALLQRVPLGLMPGGLIADRRTSRLFVANYTADLNGSVLWRRYSERWWPRVLRALKDRLAWLPFDAPPKPPPSDHPSITMLDLRQL